MTYILAPQFLLLPLRGNELSLQVFEALLHFAKVSFAFGEFDLHLCLGVMQSSLEFRVST